MRGPEEAVNPAVGLAMFYKPSFCRRLGASFDYRGTSVVLGANLRGFVSGC